MTSVATDTVITAATATTSNDNTVRCSGSSHADISGATTAATQRALTIAAAIPPTCSNTAARDTTAADIDVQNVTWCHWQSALHASASTSPAST